MLLNRTLYKDRSQKITKANNNSLPILHSQKSLKMLERSQEKWSEEPIEIQVPECQRGRGLVLHAKRIGMNERKRFDSADYFMQKEKERRLEKCFEKPIEIQVPEHYKDRIPVLDAGRVGIIKRTRFDSADYFLEQYKLRRLE